MNAQVFDFPPVKHDAMGDLEFSDIGRDPRFPPGWFIVPVWGIAALVIGGVTAWLW